MHGDKSRIMIADYMHRKIFSPSATSAVLFMSSVDLEPVSNAACQTPACIMQHAKSPQRLSLAMKMGRLLRVVGEPSERLGYSRAK